MTRHVIIIENGPIVALDLAETVLECIPKSSVKIYDTLADATADLISGKTVDIAIMARPTQEVQRSQLPRLIESEGAKIIIVTDQPQDVPADWAAIQIPFSSEKVTEVLLAAIGDPPPIPPEGHKETPAT